MKNRCVGLACLLIASHGGCAGEAPSKPEKQSAVPARATEAVTPTASPSVGNGLRPFGADAPSLDIEKPKIDKLATTDSATGMVMEMTLMQKPKYYDGPMPLKYKTSKGSIGSNRKYTIHSDFGLFKVEYAYSDVALMFSGLADGARAVDRNGKLLAEAKLVEIEKGKSVLVDEFHYNRDGSVRFYSRSTFDLVFGNKESESNSKGVKYGDFFYLWPTNGF